MQIDNLDENKQTHIFPDAQLSVEALSFYRNYQKIFADVSFAINNAEILHVKGVNGAGKTTLLRLLSSLSSPKSGEIKFNGENIYDLAHIYHQSILYLGHQLGLKDDLAPLENIQTLLKIKQLPYDENKVKSVFAHLGLQALNRPLRYLSAGQRRRVALSRLWLEPKVLWILDEPFTALDVETVALLEQKFLEHKQANGIIILTSHQALSSFLAAKIQLL